MRLSLLALMCVLMLAVTLPAAAVTHTEDFESYSLGALKNQNGWYVVSGTSRADIIGTSSGPSLPGSRCVHLDNYSGTGIRLYKDITDLVSSDKILTIQYDVRNLTNKNSATWGMPSTFRMRVFDSVIGSPAISAMHYDGGGGPACQAWANNGSTNAWAPGGPAWVDTGWHTVTWRLNYATREFVSVTFDGTQYPQPGWYFSSSASRANRMEIYLNGPDGNNDVWEIDNIILTSIPIPQPIPISTAKKDKADGEPVDIQGVVSGVFTADSPPCFYLQDSSVPCGIQVRFSGNAPLVDQTAQVTGAMGTDPVTHERYVDATGGWQGTGSGTLKPLGLNTRALGGGALGLQEGVLGGSGLNNIGLLVKVCGSVTGRATDGSYLYISDGSGADDGGGTAGVKVDLTAIEAVMRPASEVGDRVDIVGISSTYELDGNRYRTVRVRSGRDFTNRSMKICRALVINFDPIVASEGNKRVHEVFAWGDPPTLARQYIDDLKESSGGWAQFEIVDWYDADYFPYFEDGYQYTAEEFVAAWRAGGPYHGGTSDYPRIIRDKIYPHNNPLNIAERIASGEIDEVFMFCAPYACGFWESSMAGTTPYWINGVAYPIPEAGRNFVLMGFNYERDVGCMLEDFAHRAEYAFKYIWGSWNWTNLKHNWDKFSAFERDAPGKAACGNVHYAPNSLSDYDWGNTTYVYSTCDDWLYNWPNLTGAQKLVNCTEWGNGDMRLHHLWWFKHLPRKPGTWTSGPPSSADYGKQNNWWKYLVDFNSYPESQ